MLTALGVPSALILVALQIAAGVADHVAVFVELEGARASVGTWSRLERPSEVTKKLALDGEIQRVVGKLQRPWGTAAPPPRRYPLPTWVLALTKMELA